MSCNAISLAAAAEFNDMFAKLGWQHHGFRAYPCELRESVVIQYKSATWGDRRTVICDSVRLALWLKNHAVAFGGRTKFEAILDQKSERPAPPLSQGELNLGREASPLVRASMSPENN